MIYECRLDKMRVYHNTAGKLPEQIKRETGCTTIFNGVLFNGNGSLCEDNRIDGKTISNAPYSVYGFGWNKDELPMMVNSLSMCQYENFVSCLCAIHQGKKQPVNDNDRGIGGTRGRTAFGFKADGTMVVLCTSDSNGAMKLSAARDKLAELGCVDALILDGGGSCYLNCPSGKVDAAYNRKTANRTYILVWEETQKKGSDEMNIRQNLTTVNRNVCNNRNIEWIVVHYFGALANAKDTCAYFKSVNRQASAHYFVDEYGIWQCVLDKDVSWHCGDNGAGGYKGKCTNANSIGIETRPYKLNTASLSASDNDWYFDPKTADKLVELIRYLMDKYNIDADHVIRHYDVTGKWCPRPFMGDDYNPYFQKSGNQIWSEFKKRLTVQKPEKPAAPTGGTIYRVQVGAFTVKDNAVNLKTELEKKGYKPYIVEAKK